MGLKVQEGKAGRMGDYRAALRRSLVTDLLGHEKITTTEAKARDIRGLAEKMITLGKRGDLHARRQALAYIFDKSVVEKVFSELADRYASRSGGYTRIIKLSRRLGDGAPMVQLELVKE